MFHLFCRRLVALMACLLLVCTPVAQAATIRPGDVGSAVRSLQKDLKTLGYYNGNIDGEFGNGTKSAVEKFQRAEGLTVDGKAGDKTLDALEDALRSKSSSGTLQSGDSGSKVKSLQQSLKKLGFYTGSIDGKYGSSTVSAVKAFQRKAGLTADGKAGAKTLAAIAAGKITNTSGSTATESASPATLSLGSSGTAVKNLQQALKNLGYYTGSVDGQYGAGTAGAVKAFQRDANLYADGKAGAKTLAAIAEGKVSKKDDNSLSIGDSGSEVKSLQRSLKKLGFYTGSVDGQFGTGTYNAVRAFQQARGLTADGKAGVNTLEALKKSYPTESLDWFKNGNATIPRGAVLTVKDVQTGKTFQVKRWAGANHADVEPLTADDTAVMKSIYGTFSWQRRAILVMYNGHVYAASMNGMPHGTQTITNNNFNGHFCIHFTGSRTHGTNKVDSDHQNAVQRALKAVW